MCACVYLCVRECVFMQFLLGETEKLTQEGLPLAGEGETKGTRAVFSVKHHRVMKPCQACSLYLKRSSNKLILI